MSKCQFGRNGWKCPLNAEEGEDLCYWHQEREEKKPSDEQLDELKSKRIDFIYLKYADLTKANLKDAQLVGTYMQRAVLNNANMQKAKLMAANLQNASLSDADLEGADLRDANLKEAILMNANFTDSNMQFTLFDTESYLDGSILKNANLYQSFIDSAKSLRNAILFERENLNEKEVNEQKADEATVREEKSALYQASLDVYNKLYHFYSDEGMDFRAKHAHYRRAEVKRKLLLVKNKWYTISGIRNRIRSWVFDFLILKTLTGYGESILRPVLISAFWIIAFGSLFWHFDGIEVTGRSVRLIDYFYLSLTTFTGLGFSNVQPDITVPCMQYLVMAESIIGVTMVALIIFVVTYQISAR